MKIVAAGALIAAFASASAALALEPIPGSITYAGKQANIVKAPAGSTLFHNFNFNGDKIREVYKVNADHTVTLVQRGIIND